LSIPNFTDFFTQGFIFFEDFSSIDIDAAYQLHYPNSEDNELYTIPEEARVLLQRIQQEFAQRYIVMIFNQFKIKEIGIWDGADSGSIKWHNDNNPINGMNANLLIYLDDCNPETGGKIEVRSDHSYKFIYPRRGQAIFLNQSPQFQHKVTRSSKTRRVISLEYFIDDLVSGYQPKQRTEKDL
tara:strand:- start:20119 stop:20667 length:549 start_codon:yes stop_codon:yes gene_type:complete